MSCPSGHPPELTLARVREVFLPEYLRGRSVPAHQLKVLRRLGRCRSVQLGWTVWHSQHAHRWPWGPHAWGAPPPPPAPVLTAPPPPPVAGTAPGGPAARALLSLGLHPAGGPAPAGTPKPSRA